ncbi:MAG: hypothetical protein OHK0052_25140 [Anaerolineales bacterium]
MILLDTDVMIDVLRGYEPAIAWLQSIQDEEIGLPGLVVMELLQGCKNAQEQRKLQKQIKAISVFWATEQDCMRAMTSYAAFHLSHQLGILDSLIGETAIGLGAQLATFNLKHYQALNALRTLQPYPR